MGTYFDYYCVPMYTATASPQIQVISFLYLQKNTHWKTRKLRKLKISLSFSQEQSISHP